MIKSTLLAAATFIFLQVNAQAQAYSFTNSTAAYADLTNPTSLSGNTIWDDEDWQMSIGFPFTVNGQTYQNIGVADGAVFLLNTSTFQLQYLVPFGDDLVSRGTPAQPAASPITHQLSGTPGNRIAKIEWKNAGFVNGTAADFINFQLWLYENGNAFEVRFGPGSMTSGQPNALAGFISHIDTSSFALTGQLLSGPPANPQLQNFVNASIITVPFITALPPNGTVWRFSTNFTAAASDLEQLSATLAPNPFTQQLQVMGLPAHGTVNVYDQQGRLVKSLITSGMQTTLELGHVAAGLYLVEITAQGQRITRQIVKE